MENHHKNEWYYDSDSSASLYEERSHIEWKDKIDTDGNLFFVKCFPVSNLPVTGDPSNPEETNLKNTTGIIGRLIRRRNSRRTVRKSDNLKVQETEETVQNNHSLIAKQADGITEDLLLINVQKNKDAVPNLGRRATLTEQYIGLKTLSRNSQVIITGFLEIPSFQYSPKIILGDVLISINGSPISSENLDLVVSKNAASKEIILGVKRAAKEDFHVYDSIKYSNLKIHKDESVDFGNMGILFVKLDSLNKDEAEENEGIIYSYPKNNNVLTSIKGIFLTLFHLLPVITSSKTISTTIKVNNQLSHITYTSEKDELLLVSLPHSRYSLIECLRITLELVQYQKFVFQTLSRCFHLETNKNSLSIFFQMFFMQIKEEINSANISRQFETILMTALTLPLPRDIYVQIDDALNELESNDFLSEENERLYSIIGSCYICKGYVMCSHLSKDDLTEVVTIFRQSGLMKLCEDGVKELVYWREVYPSSYSRGLSAYSHAPYSTPTGRWFLLVIAQHNDFIATLLESGGCTARLPNIPSPDVNLVEEVQATLHHIMNLGIPHMINKLIRKQSEDSENLRGSHHRLELTSSHQNLSLLEFSSKQLNELEDVERISNDNLPVLGRRAERELAREVNLQSRISVSDVSDDSDWTKDGKQTDHSSDVSDFSKSTLRDLNLQKPIMRIETLLHYVNLDRSEGILISNSGFNVTTQRFTYIMNTFRKYAHKIQQLFMNTITFKKLKTKELHQFSWNKSLVAIKEYGILFEYNDTSDKKSNCQSYWVVGRLFCSPKLREVYVCYQDICPQNMIELAFHLALSSAHL